VALATRAGPHCLSFHPQTQNMWLRQHVLDLRRAVRVAGCDLNNTITFFPFSELEAILANHTAKASTKAGPKGIKQDRQTELTWTDGRNRGGHASEPGSHDGNR
jgi:hypothetical protein